MGRMILLPHEEEKYLAHLAHQCVPHAWVDELASFHQRMSDVVFGFGLVVGVTLGGILGVWLW